MANCIAKRIEFEPLKRGRVEVNLDSGEVSSDGGVLLVRKLERRVGLLDAVARMLRNPRDPASVMHGLADLLRQRVFGSVGPISLSSARKIGAEQLCRQK